MINRIKNFFKRKFKADIFIVFLYRIAIVYFLYTLSRLIFYIYNIQHFDINFNGLIKIFLGGLKFDTTAIIYTNLLFIAMSIIPFRFRHNSTYQKVLKYIFFVTNGIGLLANFADIPYFDFVLERSTIKIFQQFENETNLGPLFLKFIFDYWTITISYIFSIILMVYLYNRTIIKSPFPSNKWFYYPSSLIIMLIILLASIAGIRGDLKHSTRPITMSNAGQYVKQPIEMSIVLNTPFCLIRSTEGVAYSDPKYFSADELNKIYNPIHYPKNNTIKRNLNVVIIIVESLNKEFVGRFYNWLDEGKYKGYTPFLDSLVDNGYTFVHSYANGRKSIDALASVLSSIPSIESPYVLSPYYSNSMTTIPLLLKEMGYKSALFHGAPNGSMGFYAFSKLAGVDEYYGKDEYHNDKDFDGTWAIWDEEFLQYMANVIDTFTRPFVATVFTATSHHPFKLPEKYDERFKSVDFPLQRCIEYTDYAIARFFHTASRMKWYDSTLFVITADHVSINQRPEFKNPIGYFSVPIIFFQPNGKLKRIDSITIAQQIDILPTVVNYLGYDKPYIAFGQDLFNADENKFAINYLNGIYRFYYKNYMIEFDGNKLIHMYDVKKDAELKDDIINKFPEKQEQLEKLLKAFIQQYKHRMIKNELTIKNNNKEKS